MFSTLRHKKKHSVFGDASESLAIRMKDVLKYKHNLLGYFDADNLRRITLEKLEEGVALSVCVLLFLNDGKSIVRDSPSINKICLLGF